MKNSTENKDIKLNDSIARQLARQTLIPLIMLTIIIIIVSASTLYETMIGQIKDEMVRDAQMVYMMYEVSGTDIRIDDMSETVDLEISLFLKDSRVLTTLKTSEGDRAIGTRCSPIVVDEVLKTGEARFYSNVSVYDAKSYAYYMPLISEDGEVYGMIGVCRTSEVVYGDVLGIIWPIVLICLLTALIVGYIMMHFSRRLSNRISLMDKFMIKLADGDFNSEMPRPLTQKEDEIKRLARQSQRMAGAMQKLVEMDALTEINNRRSGEKRLQESVNKLENYGENFCVAIADIDFFKKVNDTYGHEMGDLVLKAVADKLRKGVVAKGFVARWGGEEFLIILDNVDLQSANEILEGILEDVRTIIIPDTEKNITMSFGVTAVLEKESGDEALKRADANLYEAKETGRNQIIAK